MRVGVEVGYKGRRDVLILSKGLASAMEDPSIIDNKLEEDLRLRKIIPVPNLSTPFISSPLGLVPKHDGGFRRIQQ